MRFDKYMPSPALQSFVKHFVVSETEEAGSYRVLPGTSVVMGFQYRGSLSKINDDTQSHLAISGITGLQSTFNIFMNSSGTGTVLVYFTETGASHFFRVPLNEIFSQSLSLDTFIRRSALGVVEEQLAGAATDQQRIAIVEHFLLSQLKEHYTDKLVTEAVRLIIASKGSLRINELAKNLYISQSPLEKRFRGVVGTSPKKFSSIVRFQAVIKSSKNSANLTELSHESGYFDQAHFIKDFRSFTGETPESFFSVKKK